MNKVGMAVQKRNMNESNLDNTLQVDVPIAFKKSLTN